MKGHLHWTKVRKSKNKNDSLREKRREEEELEKEERGFDDECGGS